MLVNNPQTIVAGSQNERRAQLSQRPERAKVVEVGRGLFGLDQGRFRSGICASRTARARGTIACGRQAGRLKECRCSLTPCFLIPPIAGLEVLGSKRQLAGDGRGQVRCQRKGLRISPGCLERGRIGVGLLEKLHSIR